MRSGVLFCSQSSASSGSPNDWTSTPGSIEAASLAKMFRFVTRSSTITMIDIGSHPPVGLRLCWRPNRHNGPISLRESELSRRLAKPRGGKNAGLARAFLEISDLSAVELAERFASRALSPVEALDAVLAVVERWEPHLQATYAFDPKGAYAAARAAEKRWREGQALSPVDGVPVTVKENIASKGVPVPLGTLATALVKAAEDAPPVARLREAGAVIFSKTTMPDYGMLSSSLSSFQQMTRKPWDLTRTPGGSSSGAGAAAVAGYGPLHIGTDIGGSVRLPATWCGIFTLKPSLGRITIDPPYMGRVVGPMTRTVTDAARLMAVLARPDARDHMNLPPSELAWDDLDRNVKGVRIGYCPDIGSGLPVEPKVGAAIEAAVRTYEQAGAQIEVVRPFVTPEMIDGLDRFWRARAYSDFLKLPPATVDKVLPFIRACVQKASTYSGEDVFSGYAQTVILS